MSAVTAYDQAVARWRRIALIDEARAVLDWDRAAMMPPGGAAARAEQLAALALTAHELTVDPALGDLLAAALEERAIAADPWRAANLAAMRRLRAHAAALPPELVEALSKACSACEIAWRSARAADDFAGLLPQLDAVLRLTREAAAAKAAALGLDPYDALLDAYEPGGRAARIDALFAELAAFLPGLIDRAVAAAAARPAIPPEGPFPLEAQAALGRRLMAALGFEFDHGRLDVSHHPFCGGVPDDLRLTTRYAEQDFASALMGVLHETGHALYERGLPRDWRLQPVGQAGGMSAHESQSLFIEMQLCRSAAFQRFAAPLIADAFGRQGDPALTAENLYALATRCRRSLIRVDADEVTYPAHVVLRYRLERALIAGDLPLADLPGAWADGMRALVGIAPEDDRDGCLQDIHWPAGAFGYFPTYTLGAMLAAQLRAAAERALGPLDPFIARGDFAPILAWLRTNVHAHGARYDLEALAVAATGAPLGVAAYRAHLEQRYL